MDQGLIAAAWLTRTNLIWATVLFALLVAVVVGGLRLRRRGSTVAALAKHPFREIRHLVGRGSPLESPFGFTFLSCFRFPIQVQAPVRSSSDL